MNRFLPAQTPKRGQSKGRSDTSHYERASGIVQDIDLVGRDLTVLLESGTEVFDIPPDCPVILHGEKVKLRMVQPRDNVWITFMRTPERLVVVRLEVQPDSTC